MISADNQDVYRFVEAFNWEFHSDVEHRVVDPVFVATWGEQNRNTLAHFSDVKHALCLEIQNDQR